MPKGAKKRKAAKKKALSHNQNHNQQTHPESAVSDTHENDELKHHDDKDSEGEEVSSPASQDHPNSQHQFTDGEKEDVKKVEDSSYVHFSAEENKSNGAAVEESKVEESLVQIEREPTPAGELNGKNIIDEGLTTQKESGDGVVSQSLDAESAIQFERESELFEKADASVELSEPQKEHSDGALPKLQNDEHHVIDKTNVFVDSSPFGSSTEAINSLCEDLAQVANTVPVGEVYSSVVETGFDMVRDEKINIDSSSAGDNLLNVNEVPGMYENGKKEVAMGIENKGDEAIIQARDAARALEVKSTVTQETEETLMHFHRAPKNEAANYGSASNGADHIKDSELLEHSEKQPLVASAVRPAQRTSWMSCCGIFDVFSGSSR